MIYLGKSVERGMYFGAKPVLFNLAKEMRKNPTESERILWKHLRKFRAKGFLFRQQHPIDIFIADFYCRKIKLVIEVDGEVHCNEQAHQHDDGRTGDLEKYGIKVIRFWNNDVLDNIEGIYETIIKNIKELLPASSFNKEEE